MMFIKHHCTKIVVGSTNGNKHADLNSSVADQGFKFKLVPPHGLFYLYANEVDFDLSMLF